MAYSRWTQCNKSTARMKTISLTTRQSFSYVDMHYFSTAQALWAVQGPQPPKRSWSLCWHAYFLFARLENFTDIKAGSQIIPLLHKDWSIEISLCTTSTKQLTSTITWMLKEDINYLHFHVRKEMIRVAPIHFSLNLSTIGS